MRLENVGEDSFAEGVTEGIESPIGGVWQIGSIEEEFADEIIGAHDVARPRGRKKKQE